MHILRLETLHPMLVHVTVGMMPLLVIAFVVAWSRKSDAWAFVADVSLAVIAASAVLSAASGLYLQFFFPWPGGLTLWRYLHLGLGATATVILLVFATVRLRRRAKQSPKLFDTGSMLTAIGTGAVILGTGWIGGEVLVFRSGMAVEAAGKGALALPVPGTADYPPKNLHQAMYALRAHWSQAVTTTARSLVEEPTSERYAEIRIAADEIVLLAQWLQDRPSEHAGFGQIAEKLKNHGQALSQSAEARDISKTTAALGEVTNTCANCHQEFRWNGHEARAHSH